MNTSTYAFDTQQSMFASGLISNALKCFYSLICAPEMVFFAALTAMLFRPPDLKAFPADRLAFVVLLAVAGIRLVLTGGRIRVHSATWPMLLLALLGLLGVLAQSYQAQAWSLLVAKWIVPIALFHLAGTIFVDDRSLRKLEIFALAVLCYLSVIAVFHLLDVKALVFPKFILDEGIGIHADRARGPFLQAVANGVSLNVLGLLALSSFERRRLPRLLSALLAICAPLAVLATRTRAVWFAALVSLVLMALFPPSRTVRRVALSFCFLGAIGFASFFLYRGVSNSFVDRLQDRSPVDFRMDMYRAGWQMFTEKPFTGWGSESLIQPEIERRISDFHPDYYLFHNTYLELAVERGMLGLGLYAWLMVSFFRLAKAPAETRDNDPLRKFWPFILIVYLLNASAVVMNYQFVNGFVFSLAGILSARNARSKMISQRSQLAY